MRVPSSFRDPSGHIFLKDGEIYRQVNHVHREHYDFLMDSGLYDALIESGLLIRHQEIDFDPETSPGVYKILKPEPIPFITYPYEWCFSQLKDVALTTLRIQRIALEFNMTLRDSSAYNVQFLHGRPVFIDTLSFGKYEEGEPWVAYKQFCQHFLAPLALASYRHIGLSRLLQTYIDGIPLELAHTLLPIRTRLRPSLLIHIHLHARFQDKFRQKSDQKIRRKGSFKRTAFLGLIDNLESLVKKLKWRPARSEWIDYYEDDSYTPEAFDHKAQLITELLQQLKPKSVWDMGSNVGFFSRIASEMGIPTVAFDQDPAIVERNYQTTIDQNEPSLLPIVLDLANPSSKIGWANNERMDLVERGPADMLFALGLLHHLAIGSNLPLELIAGFFRKLCNSAIVEFVPTEDPKLAQMLMNHEGPFHTYDQDTFEKEFNQFFETKSVHRINDSGRTLYVMRGR